MSSVWDIGDVQFYLIYHDAINTKQFIDILFKRYIMNVDILIYVILQLVSINIS